MESLTRPFEEQKTGIFQKRISSYTIFMKYISFEKGESFPDVSKIFSHECFAEWLSTRSAEKMKFPPSTYQRNLYAHIRGAEKRRPFPKAVEEELLKLIRSSKRNLWVELFKDQKVQLGKRGFISKGYHERLNLQIQNNNSKKPDALSKSICSKRSASALEMEAYQSLILPVPDLRERSCPWEILIKIIERYYPVKLESSTLEDGKVCDLNILPPAIYYFLNDFVDSTDFRFSYNFQFPSSEEEIFRLDQPLARIVVSEENIVIHEDENALFLFRGSLLDKNAYEMYASLLSVYYSLIHFIPKVFATRCCWRREVLRKCDGTKMVCLFRVLIEDDLYVIDLQDQSELYSDLLRKDFFI